MVQAGKVIRIAQARVHNLKNIAIDVPLGQLVALAGKSGSGKSSLAHGVIYAAAQGHKVEAKVTGLPRRVQILQQRTKAEPQKSLCESTMGRLNKLLTGARTGDLLIVDEPCVGMTRALRLEVLKKLHKAVAQGVSVIVIEHCREIITGADYVIEFGPEAGAKGGRVVFAGPQKEYEKAGTVTARFAYGRAKIAWPPQETSEAKKWLAIKGINQHHLKNESFRFPLHRLVCLAGAMGSGKSTLLGVAYGALFKGKNAWQVRPRVKSIEGKTHVRRSYIVDQSLLSNVSTSTPATYLGVWTEVRKVFAATAASRRKKLSKSDFSFNVKKRAGGSDEVTYKGLTVADVLALTIDEAAAFFADIPLVARKLGFLQEVGLGYLSLAQRSGTLSGGEAQRVRLAKILSKKLGDRCLYILDTPSRGLHLSDGPILARVLRRIIDKNNTVLIAENREDIQRACDCVVGA